MFEFTSTESNYFINIFTFTEIVDKVSSDHTMFALVVFIQGHEDHQNLGPVLREMLVANETNNLAGKPRIIILIKIQVNIKNQRLSKVVVK